jgi:hypothetical protein
LFSERKNDEESPLQIGVIAGIAAGGVIACAIVIAVIVYFRRRRGDQDEGKSSESMIGEDCPDNIETVVAMDLDELVSAFRPSLVQDQHDLFDETNDTCDTVDYNAVNQDRHPTSILAAPPAREDHARLAGLPPSTPGLFDDSDSLD